jgi:CHAT domain-containing protein/tetratricopeptide (TPR) repeat protein
MSALLLVLVLLAPPPNESAALAARAIELANDFRLDDALAEAERARAVAMACDDRAGLARALDAIGIVERSRGRAEVALDVTTEALALAEETGDADVLARVLNDLGRIHFDLLLDYRAAREAYERGLALEPRVRDRVTIARLLNNVANLRRAENDFAGAIAMYERAAAVSRAVGDRAGAVSAEHNIGLVFSQQNNPSLALVHLRRALALERAAQNRGAIARTLLSISETQRAVGHEEQALADLREARRLATRAGDRLTVASCLLREGDLLTGQRQFRRADEAIARSLELVQELGDATSIPIALAFRARLRFAQGRYGETIRIANDAGERASMLEQLDVVALAHTLAGQAQRALRHDLAARESFLAAIEAIELRRGRVVGNEESKQLYFQREVLPYLAIVDLAAARNDAQEALAYAERAKGRVLLDVLRGRDVSAPRLPANAAELLPSASDAALELAVTDLHVCVFVVTRDRGVRLVASVPRAHVTELATRFAREIGQRNLRFRTTARELYDILLAPAEEALRGKSRVCIVPDQELWRVPFQALLDRDGHYLVEHTALFYAPSLAVLREFDRVADRPSTKELLAAANRELPETVAEVGALREVYGPARTNVLVGAREDRVKAEVPGYRVLHFATHGVFDDADPLHSHLVFAPGGGDDGLLDAREMMQLHLSANLVVLSACETAAGRPVPGEGVIGMSWALFVAGCPAMVASQWKVESASTTGVMVGLHRRLAESESIAAALREAQIDVMKTPRYEHPFYWASFVLLGRGW